jgi:flagellar protein FlaG
MQIDSLIPLVDPSGSASNLSVGSADLSGNSVRDSIRIQSENRQVIQAARAVNASASLGENELTFFLDPRSRQAIIKIVNRETQEVVEQIPSEAVLRLAENLKAPE